MSQCKDCGLEIEDGARFCEFCLDRHAKEGTLAERRAKSTRTQARTASGWRGRPCGGGRGVSLEDREFFEDTYSVAVPTDAAERVEHSTETEDFTAGIVDVSGLED